MEKWHVKLLFDDDSIMQTTDACEEEEILGLMRLKCTCYVASHAQARRSFISHEIMFFFSLLFLTLSINSSVRNYTRATDDRLCFISNSIAWKI